MTLSELIDKLSLEVLAEPVTGETRVDGCFAGDLLSLAMSGVASGNIWITVQTNVNILGIAALTDASCVVVANHMNVPDSVIEKAKEENICLLRSDKPVYELCNLVGDLI